MMVSPYVDRSRSVEEFDFVRTSLQCRNEVDRENVRYSNRGFPAPMSNVECRILGAEFDWSAEIILVYSKSSCSVV